MFIKARKRATVGYLNLCIALQQLRRRQLARHIAQLSNEIIDRQREEPVKKKRVKYFEMPEPLPELTEIKMGYESIPVQINGKLLDENHALLTATALEGRTIKKIVVVPDKLINLVIE